MKLEELLKLKEFKSPFHKAQLNIAYTSIEMEANTQKILRAQNTTTSQINILRILKRQKGVAISVQGIQDMMLYKKSNVTRIIEKLVEKEYVKSVVKKDNKRMVDVTITKKGITYLDKMDPYFENFVEVIKNKLTEEEATILSDLLDKINS